MIRVSLKMGFLSCFKLYSQGFLYNSSVALKNCKSKEFSVSLFLFRKRIPHHNFWFQKVVHSVLEAFKHLIYRTHLSNTYRLVWSDTAAIIFPVTFPNTFPHRIQVHSLLHAQHSLQPQKCNRPSLPPKKL